MSNLTVLESLRNRHNASSVSERYQVVDTMQVLESLSDYVDVDSAKVRVSRKSGTKHLVSLDLRNPVDVGIGHDANRVKLHLLNSYNGDGKLSVYYGLYRFVCSNGLVIGSSIFNASVKHIKGPAMATALDGLRETLIGTDLEQLTLSVNAMAVKEADYVGVSQAIAMTNLPETIAQAALRAYMHPIRQGDVGNSVWLAYNRVQEVVAAPKRGMAGVRDNVKLMDNFLSVFNS